jgi:hypothetical protein
MAKTLRFLERSNYPKDRIIIFVASEAEADLYKVCTGYKIVVGVLGIVPQRNFISNWLDDDEIYISMDDDITDIKSHKPFLELIKDATLALETRRGGLWGTLPKDDARCFKDDTTEHLSFIIGAFFVARNHRILVELAHVEDYERTILYFIRYGRVFRYRGAGVSTQYKGTSEAGTRQQFLEGKKVTVQRLIERHPDMCKYRDKSGEPDIQLNWRFSLTP